MNTKFLAVLVAICCALASLTTCASASERYPVSLSVSEVKMERVGEVLFRYIEFSSDYPCIRFETIQPISHKLIDRVEACTFRVNGKVIDVTRNDLAGVGYKDSKLQGSVFHFTADIVVGGSGPALPPLNCKVTISSNGKLSEPSCAPAGGAQDPGDSEQR